jgi:hypothetical protein
MHADLTQPSGDQCSRTTTPPLSWELTDVKDEDVRAGFDCACSPELRLQVGDGFDPQLRMTLASIGCVEWAPEGGSGGGQFLQSCGSFGAELVDA